MTESMDIQELFKIYGPICNSEGFYQHTGQCWSDTLQMLLLYSDGLKEITQPIFALNTFTYVDIARIFSGILSTLLYKAGVGIEEVFMEQNLKSIFEYFKAVQERFRRHYVAEVLRLTEYGPKECYTYEFAGNASLESLKKIARESRSKNKGVRKSGIRSAIMGKATVNYLTTNRETIGITSSLNSKYYIGGFSTIEIPYILSLYNELGSLNIAHRSITSANLHIFKVTSQTIGLYVTITKNTKESLHAVGFFPCGKKEYYYDDNYGVIAFPYSRLLNAYATSGIAKRKLIFGGKFTVIRISPSVERIFSIETYPLIEEETEDFFYYTTFIETVDIPMKQIQIKVLKKGNPADIRLRSEVYMHENIEYRVIVNLKENQYDLDQIIEIYKTSPESSGSAGVESKYNRSTGKFIGSRLMRPSSYLTEGIIQGDRRKILNAIKNKKESIQFQTAEKSTILHTILGMNDIELLEELLNVPGSPIDVQNKNGFTPLNLAVSANLTEAALVLVEKGANVMIPSNYIPEWNKEMLPLDYAIYLKNNELIYALLGKMIGMGPSVLQPYLNTIVGLNDSDLLRRILQLKVDPNVQVNGQFPLEIAVQMQNAENVKLLLDHGALIKLVDKTNEMTLFEVLIKNWKSNDVKEVIDEFVKHGENPLRTLKKGYTYLMKAATNPLAFDALLSKYPFDLTQTTMDGTNIVMILASASSYNTSTYRQLPIATMLEAVLEMGKVNINLQDKQGNTALMMAADQANTGTVQILCQYGADSQIKNKKNKTVYDLISVRFSKQDPETFQALRAALEGCKKKKGGKSHRTRRNIHCKANKSMKKK